MQHDYVITHVICYMYHVYHVYVLLNIAILIYIFVLTLHTCYIYVFYTHPYHVYCLYCIYRSYVAMVTGYTLRSSPGGRSALEATTGCRLPRGLLERHAIPRQGVRCHMFAV